MARVKTKTIKKGQIDVSSFSSKRKIDVEKGELEDFVKSIFRMREETAPTVIRDENGEFVTPKEKTYKAVEGRIEMSENYDYPEFATDLVQQIRILYNLKDEAENFKMMIYPPYKGDVKNEKVFEIPKTNINTVSRIIFVVGHREQFKFSASAGGQSGDGSVICMDLDSFSIPIGVGSGLDISFDTSRSAVMPYKKGFRSGSRVEKDPSKRYIGIIDFSANTQILTEHIASEASKLANGNDAAMTAIKNKMGSAFNLSKDEQVDELLEEMEKEESSPLKGGSSSSVGSAATEVGDDEG